MSINNQLIHSVNACDRDEDIESNKTWHCVHEPDVLVSLVLPNPLVIIRLDIVYKNELHSKLEDNLASELE